MKSVNTSCTIQTTSTEALLKKRNTLAALVIGISAGYVFLIAFYIGKNGFSGDNSDLVLVISFFISMIAMILIVSGEWQKLTNELNIRNKEKY
jgi:RsiW-degrading membrane proteinase PrsW (M82 family)